MGTAGIISSTVFRVSFGVAVIGMCLYVVETGSTGTCRVAEGVWLQPMQLNPYRAAMTDLSGY